MQAWIQFDVHQVFVARQHVASIAVLEEVNARDVIALEEDELVVQFYQRLQEGTDPRDERDWSVQEELELLECAFEDEQGHFQA